MNEEIVQPEERFIANRGGPKRPMTTCASVVVFVVSSAAFGFAFWRWADWWVYVEMDEGKWVRKFEVDWWIQLAVSGLVGCVGGWAMLVFAWLASELYSVVKKPRP
jgi:hypothetical protein